MKNLLEKYLLRGITFEGEGAGSGGGDGGAALVVAPAAAAPAAAAPSEVASQVAAPAAAAPATALGQAAAAAAAAAAPAKEPVKTEAAAEYQDDPAKSAEGNAAAKAEHDAAQAAKAKEAAEKKEGEGGEEVDPASYKIELPAGFELDAGIDKQFREFAAKNNFTQEQVASLKDMQVALYSKQAEALATQVTAWRKQAEADKEFGGPNVDANFAVAGTAINEFFEPEVAALLDQTGLGNHPGMIRGFYRIGLTMGELPTFNARTGGSGKLDAVQVLYGDK